MNDQTANFVKRLLDSEGGDHEALARYMSRTLRIGGIKVCRELIGEALSHIALREEPTTHPIFGDVSGMSDEQAHEEARLFAQIHD